LLQALDSPALSTLPQYSSISISPSPNVYICLELALGIFVSADETGWYSTHSKFGNTATVFRAFSTAAYGQSVSLFCDNSRLSYRKEKIKISSGRGNNKLPG
jgi:hypothetical protein